MAATREQTEERRFERLRLEVEGRYMAMQVVDWGERKPTRPRKRLGRRKPDQERPDQAWAVGDPHSIDVVERRPAPVERLGEHRSSELEVTPGGNLGNDAAVP